MICLHLRTSLVQVLQILSVSSIVFSFKVYRNSKKQGDSIAISEDYFSNEDKTNTFCTLRNAECVPCGYSTGCCQCKCQSKTNFYSEGVGCLSFQKLQSKLEDNIGMKCEYGVNQLHENFPKLNLPSFMEEAKVSNGYELQEIYKDLLPISRLGVRCEIHKFLHLNVDGKVLPISQAMNKSLFNVERGSKRWKRRGFKLVNIKLLKFTGTAKDWKILEGKLLLLYITCSDELSSDILQSCFLFNINGTDTIYVPTSVAKPSSFPITIIRKTTATPTKKITNSTDTDKTKTKTDAGSFHLIPIIIGVVVSLIIIVIVACGLFFIKRKRKGRHKSSEKRALEEIQFAPANKREETPGGEYDYADPDKVRFKQKEKKKTLAQSTNPYYKSGDAPDREQEKKNILYETEDQPHLGDKTGSEYEPLADTDDPSIYNECSPKPELPEYVEYVDPDSPRYQPLAERDLSPEYKGLYKTPKSQERPQSPEYAMCENPDSPVYREVYPDWP